MRQVHRLVLVTALLVAMPTQALAEDAPPAVPVQAEGVPSQATMPGGGAVNTGSVATQPAAPFSWDAPGTDQHAMQWPPDEPRQPHMLLTVLAPALVMVVLVIVGFTFTIRCMRAESQRNRIIYRTRGPSRAHRPAQQAPYTAAREIAAATAFQVASKALRVKPAPDGNQSPALPSASV